MFLDIACAFIGEYKDFAASVLDSSNSSANAIIEVLVDKCLITVSASNTCLQMHELIQCMAREIIREEFSMPGNHSRRLWISSEDDILNVNKVAEEVEVLVLLLKKNCQNIPIDGQPLTRMKNLRILKICFPKVEGHWQPFAVNFSGRLDLLSNKLRLLYWHGLPLKFLPSYFYPENIVAIDLSYSYIKQLWTTPKCLKKLKVMKLRYCCNLTTTPDFSEITSLEELDLEGCVNMVTVHPSIGMLKRLVVLNLKDCTRVRSFPSKVEMDSLRVLNLSGCLKVDQLPEALGRIKTLTELHIDRTAITELPSFVSLLINLESLSFGGQGRIQPRWWTSLAGFIWNQQHPQRSVSLEGLHMLKYLNLSYCNLEQVPESIGGLSCLEELHLEGNNFTSLPELPHRLYNLYASDCTSLREVAESSKDPFWYRGNEFRNCPKLFKNVTIDSEGSISKTECLDSSITSQGSIHQLSAYLGYLGFPTNGCEFFKQDTDSSVLDIVYHGNSIPEWFTNRSTENHVKVELPSDWCYDKFRGYGTCVVFKRKKPHKLKGYFVKNFDGASLNDSFDYYIPLTIRDYFEKEVIGIQDLYMIWLRYTRATEGWEEVKNFVTFCFKENYEDVEVKECGVRVVYDEENNENVANLSMLQDLPTPSGGAMSYFVPDRHIAWSW